MGWTNQSANPNSCCCPEDLFPVPAACSLQPHLVSPQFRRLSQLPLGSLPCSSLIPLEVASVSFSCSSWRSTPILKHVIGGSRFTVTCHLMIHFYMITWVFHFQLRCWRGKSFFFRGWLLQLHSHVLTGTETWHFSLVNLEFCVVNPNLSVHMSICGSRRGAWPWALPLPWWSETRFGSGGSCSDSINFAPNHQTCGISLQLSCYPMAISWGYYDNQQYLGESEDGVYALK